MAEPQYDVHTAACADCGDDIALIELRLAYSPDEGFGTEVVCPVCFERRLDGRELTSE